MSAKSFLSGLGILFVILLMLGMLASMAIYGSVPIPDQPCDSYPMQPKCAKAQDAE